MVREWENSDHMLMIWQFLGEGFIAYLSQWWVNAQQSWSFASKTLLNGCFVDIHFILGGLHRYMLNTWANSFSSCQKAHHPVDYYWWKLVLHLMADREANMWIGFFTRYLRLLANYCRLNDGIVGYRIRTWKHKTKKWWRNCGLSKLFVL